MSSVVNAPAGKVWAIIRPFDDEAMTNEEWSSSESCSSMHKLNFLSFTKRASPPQMDTDFHGYRNKRKPVGYSDIRV